MADTTTTNYGLTKPEVGASEDTWGTKINTNLDTLDTTVDSIQGKSGAGVLKHTNNTKLATTSTGIDVTGSVVADGLTVNSGAVNTVATFESTDSTLVIPLIDSVGSTQIRSIDGSFAIRTGGDGGSNANTVESLRIDASGNVGIGVTNVGAPLDIGSANPKIRLTDTDGGYSELRGNGGVITLTADAGNTVANSAVTFETDGTERMRIDSSGRVGIGTSSPSQKLHVYESSTGSQAYVTVQNNRSRNAAVLTQTTNGGFYTGTSIGTDTLCWQVYDASAGERVRIDSSGNLLVGTTATDTAAVGFRYRSSLDAISSVADGGISAYFGRRTSDGDIVAFRKNDAIVGSIGTTGSNLVIGTGDTGFRFFDGSPKGIFPASTSSGVTDGAIDLGKANGRFKNLYLSGGVYANNSSGAFLWNAENAHIAFGTNNAERARIDASGRLVVGYTTADGIGGAPSDNNLSELGKGYINLNRDDAAHATQIQFGKNGAVAGRIHTDDRLSIGTGSTGLYFYNSGNSILPYDNSAATPVTRDNAIDLGSSGTRFKDLYIAGLNVTYSTYNKISSYFSGSYISGFKFSDMNGGIWYDAQTDDLTVSASHANSQLILESGGSESMRIDSSGLLQIAVSGKTGRINLQPNPSNNHFVEFYNTADVKCGEINTSTGTQTNYVTSSDQRLKENIADADDAGSKIDAIQVRQYDWKVDGSHQDYGMIAQELLEVAPEAVSQGETEEEMMGVDYSKLVPMLIKEIQSLRNRVAQLEE